MAKHYPTVNYTADQVWAAVAAAHRINGGYSKYDEMTADGTVKRQTNKALVWNLLENGGEITDADREMGNTVRTHFQGKALELLSGPRNEFLFSAVKIAQRDDFTSKDRLDVAIAASLVAGYERDLVRDEARAKTFNSQHVGKIKDRVEREFEIVTCNFSERYMCYCISAIADGNNYFFFSQHKLDAGKKYMLKGTIKAHRDNGVTQLNRVKQAA